MNVINDPDNKSNNAFLTEKPGNSSNHNMNIWPVVFLTEEFNFNKALDDINCISIALNNKKLLSCKNCKSLINNALISISADGASNLLKELDIKINYALGDLDSIFDETITYLREKGITLEKYYCQDSTDLEKCFQKVLLLLDSNPELNNELISRQTNKPKSNLVCIFGSSGGRMDHSFSNLSSSLKYSDILEAKKFKIVSMSKSSITYYLPNAVSSAFYFEPGLITSINFSNEVDSCLNYRKCFINYC